ncbi:MAG: transposase [Oscillibacter sp.]|nr:transposase [Oscillibacter sp.]MCI9460752.1 transposase [Oscillibacter sp.]
MPGSNDWTLEPYNESEDFWSAVYRYHDCYGRWPERILADKLYRNRQTLSFCKEHGIRLSGPPLGKPPRDQDLSCQLKKHEYQDSCDRNEVEGVFGTGKTACGLESVLKPMYCVGIAKMIEYGS